MRPLLFLMLILLSGCSQGAKPEIKSVLVLGDSLSQGNTDGKGGYLWPWLLQEQLGEQVISLASAGHTLVETDLEGILKAWGSRSNWSHVIITLGTNDMDRGVPIDNFRRAYRKIIQDAKNKNLTPVCWVPPWSSKPFAENYDRYVYAIWAVCSSESAEIINIYKDTGFVSSSEDRVHFNSRDHLIVATHLYNQLSK